jgi:hypothetical protein
VNPEDGKPCSLKQTVAEVGLLVTVRLISALSPTLIVVADGLADSLSGGFENSCKEPAPSMKL